MVLPDVKIVIGGENGFACILSPPSQVEGVVGNSAVSLYPDSTLTSQRLHAIRTAWDAVHSGRLSLAEVCEIVITPSIADASGVLLTTS